MYDDILGKNIKEKDKNKNIKDTKKILINLLKNEKDVDDIKNKKYNSKNIWAIIINNINIEKEELVRLKNRILANTDLNDHEIVFVVGNIIINI